MIRASKQRRWAFPLRTAVALTTAVTGCAQPAATQSTTGASNAASTRVVRTAVAPIEAGSVRSIEGTSPAGSRYCNFPPVAPGGPARSVRVGMGQPCPANYPVVDTNSPPPPSAGLVEVREVGGQRFCIYAQSTARWTLSLPLTASCPISAGLALQLVARSNNQVEDRRQLPTPTPANADGTPDNADDGSAGSTDRTGR